MLTKLNAFFMQLVHHINPRNIRRIAAWRPNVRPFGIEWFPAADTIKRYYMQCISRAITSSTYTDNTPSDMREVLEIEAKKMHRHRYLDMPLILRLSGQALLSFPKGILLTSGFFALPYAITLPLMSQATRLVISEQKATQDC